MFSESLQSGQGFSLFLRKTTDSNLEYRKKDRLSKCERRVMI